jgi:hypothetical protein
MFMNCKRYSNVHPNRLKPAIKKYILVSYLLECLQHDDQQPNTAHHTIFIKCGIPSFFHLFWPLKDDLHRHNLRLDEDVIRQCMRGRLSHQKTSSPEEFMS